MDVRAQVSMVFHLDKCIGCHTCSIACKNIWTDRKGAEYQWWNNVETKPGTGYPGKWEDQDIYKGGWERGDDGRSPEGCGQRQGPGQHLPQPLPAVGRGLLRAFTYNYLT
jgi:nitrate reductase beta subunit